MAKNVSRKVARKMLVRIGNSLRDGGEVSHLNITAMMDMMTILLVFLLKQFAVQAQSMTGSDSLQLAKSTSRLRPTPAVNVSVSTNAIIVEGEPVVAIHSGAVDPKDKRDGANGYFITPLHDELEKHAHRLKKIGDMGGAPFDGTMLLLVDKQLPYRLVTEVLYSAGQAGFRNYRLVVMSKGE